MQLFCEDLKGLMENIREQISIRKTQKKKEKKKNKTL